MKAIKGNEGNIINHTLVLKKIIKGMNTYTPKFGFSPLFIYQTLPMKKQHITYTNIDNWQGIPSEL